MRNHLSAPRRSDATDVALAASRTERVALPDSGAGDADSALRKPIVRGRHLQLLARTRRRILRRRPVYSLYRFAFQQIRLKAEDLLSEVMRRLCVVRSDGDPQPTLRARLSIEKRIRISLVPIPLAVHSMVGIHIFRVTRNARGRGTSLIRNRTFFQ
jgi:hypothetical protein